MIHVMLSLQASSHKTGCLKAFTEMPKICGGGEGGGGGGGLVIVFVVVVVCIKAFFVVVIVVDSLSVHLSQLHSSIIFSQTRSMGKAT